MAPMLPDGQAHVECYDRGTAREAEEKMRNTLTVLAGLVLLAAAASFLWPWSGEPPAPTPAAPPVASGSGPARGPLSPEPAPPLASPARSEPTDAEPEKPPDPRVPGEPPEWSELDRTLADPPDPEGDRTRRDLRDTRVYVDFAKTPLPEVVRFLAGQSHLDIAVTDLTFEAFLPRELPVTLPQGSTTVAKALDAATAALGFAWWVEGSKVWVAPARPRGKIVRVTFPLGALADRRGESPDALADRIRDGIDPVLWDEGGEVEASDDDHTLVVSAPRDTQRKVLALLRERLAKTR